MKTAVPREDQDPLIVAEIGLGALGFDQKGSHSVIMEL
jgi:hypothetical protein